MEQESYECSKKSTKGNRASQLSSLAITAIVLLFPCKPLIAAEKISFSYGLAEQSVSLEDLEIFAKTGEQSPAIDFLMRYSGHNPDLVRLLLNQEIPLDARTASKLLNSPMGNYILRKASTIVNTGSAAGSPEALRGTLIRSAEDRKLSLLEVWRNYPTREVKVDGASWNKMTAGFRKTFTRVGKTTELSFALLRDFLRGQD